MVTGVSSWEKGFLPKRAPPQETASDIIPLVFLGAGVLLIAVGVVGFALSRRKKKKKGGHGANEDMLEALAQKDAIKPLPEEIVLNETREQGLKRQIKDFASGNSEIVAQLFAHRLREDDDE